MAVRLSRRSIGHCGRSACSGDATLSQTRVRELLLGWVFVALVFVGFGASQVWCTPYLALNDISSPTGDTFLIQVIVILLVSVWLFGGGESGRQFTQRHPMSLLLIAAGWVFVMSGGWNVVVPCMREYVQ